jgi:hypothetical protein
VEQIQMSWFHVFGSLCSAVFRERIYAIYTSSINVNKHDAENAANYEQMPKQGD